MQKQYVVCRFFQKPRLGCANSVQKRCYIGSRDHGVTYLIDYHDSPIPEADVQEGSMYYCGINRTLTENDRGSIVTVAVLEKIEFSRGTFGKFPSPRGEQWQCRVQSEHEVSYTLIVDSSCAKQPKTVGETWEFTQNKVVAVQGNSVIISVLLERQIISERAKRRHGVQQPTSPKEEVAA